MAACTRGVGRTSHVASPKRAGALAPRMRAATLDAQAKFEVGRRSLGPVGTQRSGHCICSKQWQAEASREGRQGGKKLRAARSKNCSPLSYLEILKKQGGVCGNVLFHQHCRDLSPLGRGYRSVLPPAPKPTCRLAGRSTRATRALTSSTPFNSLGVVLRCVAGPRQAARLQKEICHRRSTHR